MELTVDMSVPAPVEIGATGLRGLAQEIRTALATRKGSVPLDRDFGLSWELIARVEAAARRGDWAGAGALRPAHQGQERDLQDGYVRRG